MVFWPFMRDLIGIKFAQGEFEYYKCQYVVVFGCFMGNLIRIKFNQGEFGYYSDNNKQNPTDHREYQSDRDFTDQPCQRLAKDSRGQL